jgi:hypothetical protein
MSPAHNFNLKEVMQTERTYYDTRFETIEKSIDESARAISENAKATTVLAAAVETLCKSLDTANKIYQNAVPIKLVFYIITIMVAGTAAIRFINYFIP